MRKLLYSLLICISTVVYAQQNTNQTYGLVGVRSDGVAFIVPFALQANNVVSATLTNITFATNVAGAFPLVNLVNGSYPFSLFSVKSNKFFFVIDKDFHINGDGNGITNINGANIIVGTVGDTYKDRVNRFTSTNQFLAEQIFETYNTNDPIRFVIRQNDNSYVWIENGIGVDTNAVGAGTLMVNQFIGTKMLTIDNRTNDDSSFSIMANLTQTAPMLKFLDKYSNLVCYVGPNGSIYTSKTVTATNGYYFPTNALSDWPTAPRTRGESYVGNSNGWIYMLTSLYTGTTWTKTNLIAAP